MICQSHAHRLFCIEHFCVSRFSAACRRRMLACLSPHVSHIAYCVRGIGGSTIFPSFWEYSTDGLAADALALLEHLGWERTHLVGMSLGGAPAAVLDIPRNS